MRTLSCLLMATALSVAVGCAGVEHRDAPHEREPWRQIYAFPGTGDSSHELFVWDFTDPNRPVVRWFSFQENTFREWKEIVLPTKPGQVWAHEQGKEPKSPSRDGHEEEGEPPR